MNEEYEVYIGVADDTVAITEMMDDLIGHSWSRYPSFEVYFDWAGERYKNHVGTFEWDGGDTVAEFSKQIADKGEAWLKDHLKVAKNT